MLCPTLCSPMNCSMPDFPVPHYLPEFAQTHVSIESMMPSNHLILLPSIFPNITVFSSEMTLRIRWPKNWSFNFSISPSSEYSGLISFKIDCFDFLAIQGTQKSSPTPQFEIINSLVLSLLYDPILTSTYD